MAMVADQVDVVRIGPDQRQHGEQAGHGDAQPRRTRPDARPGGTVAGWMGTAALIAALIVRPS